MMIVTQTLRVHLLRLILNLIATISRTHSSHLLKGLMSLLLTCDYLSIWKSFKKLANKISQLINYIYKLLQLNSAFWEKLKSKGDDVLSGGRTKLIKRNEQVIDSSMETYYTHNNKIAKQLILKKLRKHRQKQATILYKAFHDGLTGLPNRALFFNELKLVLHQSRKDPNYKYAVLFLDLDRFKVINDSLGHVIGDQLLIIISRRLQNCIKASGTVARLGGDEFTILLRSLADVHYATKVAMKINQELAKPIYIEGNEIFTTVSIGIVTSCKNFSEQLNENSFPICPIYNHPEDVLRAADIAMYRAKDLGKARHEVFDLTMHREVVSLLELENDLRRAVEMIKKNPVNSQFFLSYQPIICLTTNKITGFECLVRWAHPTKGLIQPGKFIPLAEETGLIIPLGMWILRTACHQLAVWQKRLTGRHVCSGLAYSDCNFIAHNFTMSVNISSKNISQPNFLEQVNEILAATSCQPHCLNLEITESLIMTNVDLATAVFEKLKNQNIRLSIDDFGTGYSSLSYLHQFPINTIKIDRSFVSQLDSDTSGQTLKIVSAVIALANNLDLEIIAEGIETKAQMNQLKQLKCRKGQGYFFSKPLTTSSVNELLQFTSLTSPFL
ncbi:MAG: bifunctional diguanylate cyclase/phosphodiesterase [Trichodesmium sp. St5_bin8]|nr:bifunctional diguanylate cyclase/phosphodiesterase [Trichodesmium sp. St5_bin8]